MEENATNEELKYEQRVLKSFTVSLDVRDDGLWVRVENIAKTWVHEWAECNAMARHIIALLWEEHTEQEMRDAEDFVQIYLDMLYWYTTAVPDEFTFPVWVKESIAYFNRHRENTLELDEQELKQLLSQELAKKDLVENADQIIEEAKKELQKYKAKTT